MGFRKPLKTKVKVGKLDFVTVAKKSGVSGLSTKKFRDKATEALHQAGFNRSDIKGILSGNREMEHSTLKNVFRALQKAKITARGGGAVKEYVTKEKNRQLRLVRKHLRERADEVKKEIKQDKESVSVQAGKKKKGSMGLNTDFESMSSIEKIKNTLSPEYIPIHSIQPSVTKGKSTKNVVPMLDQDEEVRSLLKEAESHDLPID